MKKLLTLMLSMALILSLALTATAEVASMTLSAPTGAPALAVAVMAAENSESFTFLDASTIGAEFTKNEADFIIAPINAGAKLFKAGKSTYQLAAVVTWGNLYFASQREDFSEESLKGADIVLFGENTINASVVLAVLQEKGIVPGSVSYLAGAAETQAELLSNPEAIVVTADPAVTAAKIKKENVKTLSVEDMLAEAFGMEGYAQAGLFVRAETAAENPEDVAAYLAAVAEAAGKAETDVNAVAEAAVALEILPNAKVAAAAIPGCHIRFVPAAEAKADIERTAAFDLTQYGGEVPADAFYYESK
ncbi:MAG: ABC transporter substrate-binding protein [Clostridia bacterium]|nr:ABC transporter substrate-binding protein [Clostridia bacterium]